MRRIFTLLMGCFWGQVAVADDPQVLDVHIKKTGMVWRVEVTLSHNDTGWDHYADGWEVLDAEGNRLAYRELLHPHVTEQPFTRGLTNVVFPDGTREVYIRASCSADSWSGDTTRVGLEP